MRFTDRENRLVAANRRGAGEKGGRMDWGAGTADANCCINNKILLCSTGNYIQYPVTTQRTKVWTPRGEEG